MQEMRPLIYDVHIKGGFEGFETCHVFANSIGFKK